MVLVQCGSIALSLDLTKAGYCAAGSMLSLIAMNQQGIVATVQYDAESLNHSGVLDADDVFVRCDWDHNLSDAVRFHELDVCIRERFWDQCEDCLELETSQEAEIFWQGEAASVDRAWDDCSKVVGR